MTYDLKYFINKFKVIPERFWCMYLFEDNGKHCVYGHCGMRCGHVSVYNSTDEVIALYNLCEGQNIGQINDGEAKDYQQRTPKKRVLAYLYDLKANEAVKEANRILKTKKLVTA